MFLFNFFTDYDFRNMTYRHQVFMVSFDCFYMAFQKLILRRTGPTTWEVKTDTSYKLQVVPKEAAAPLTPTLASSGGEQSIPTLASIFENKDLVKTSTTQESSTSSGNGSKTLSWSLNALRNSKENGLLSSSLSRRRPSPAAATPEHRSSSETSVFDFRDSDSEDSEVPLSDLRRGLHSAPSVPPPPPPPPKDVSPEEEEEFKKWIVLCEEFITQLKDNKKIRKKMKIKLEDEIVIKEEPEDFTYDTEPMNFPVVERKGDDSLPVTPAPSRLSQNQGMIRRPRQPKKEKPVPRKRKLKTLNRGWQEEIWEFKRSLQMPGLSSRPSSWPPAPGSLPDLERLRNPPQEPPSEPDEDRTSLTKSLGEEKSFLDRLMQRYADRRKKSKKFKDSGPQPSSSEHSSTPKSMEKDPKKESVAGFRDDLPAEGDLPPDIKPKTQHIKVKRENYERERPASAPPPGTTKKELRRNNAMKKSRLGKKKKGKSNKKGEIPQLDPVKKFRTFRRKLKSSGFDYIRKKKKQAIKKEGEPKKERKKKKVEPMSEEEIQAEIKGWVLNKGIGETTLHRAAKIGNVHVLHYCLDKLHHNPAPRDNAGYTPLHIAATRGHVQVASLLLKYGANVSDSALGGVRPLHEAAENGFTKMVKLLLEHGADPQLANYSGFTPLSLATDEESRHLMEIHIASKPPVEDKNGLDSPGCCIKTESFVDEQTTDPVVSREVDGFEIEESEEPLPNLYRLSNEPRTDSWVLFHELAPLLHVKTKEALLKQLGQDAKTVFRDMKLSEFYEKAHCRAIKSATVGPKTPKVVLVKYTDTVKFLLGVEVTVIPR